MKKLMILIVLLIGMTAIQTVNAQSVTVTPATADICAGSGMNVTLNAVSSGSGIAVDWQWSNGVTGQDYIDVSPATTTTYSVTVTFIAPAGTATNSAVVTVIPQPSQGTVTPAGPTTVCTGSNVQLDASAGDAWQWYLNGSPITGATGQTHFADATGDYTVLVTVGICNAPMSAATTVTIVTPPVANVSPSGPLSACYGNVITLTADPVPGATYQWQYSPDGLAPWSDVAGETGQTYDADVSGWNRVRVTVGACESYSN